MITEKVEPGEQKALEEQDDQMSVRARNIIRFPERRADKYLDIYVMSRNGEENKYSTRKKKRDGKKNAREKKYTQLTPG